MKRDNQMKLGPGEDKPRLICLRKVFFPVRFYIYKDHVSDKVPAGYVSSILHTHLVMTTKLKSVKKIMFKVVFRIRISFHAECPYGSGCGSGSKEVNTKEE